MVSGSTAINYYAQPRMTRDIDIVVEIGPPEADRFIELFASDFYYDRDAIETAVAERGLFNLIHLELVIKVDFVVRKDSAYRREEFSRRRPVAVDDVRIFLVAPEDLLLSKLAWAKEGASEIQLADVRNLISSVTYMDWQYVERWADDLTVVALLAGVRE